MGFPCLCYHKNKGTPLALKPDFHDHTIAQATPKMAPELNSAPRNASLPATQVLSQHAPANKENPCLRTTDKSPKTLNYHSTVCSFAKQSCKNLEPEFQPAPPASSKVSLQRPRTFAGASSARLHLIRSPQLSRASESSHDPEGTLPHARRMERRAVRLIRRPMTFTCICKPFHNEHGWPLTVRTSHPEQSHLVQQGS